MSEDVHRRLERLESLVEDQQETIEAQRERLGQLEPNGEGEPRVVLDGGNVKVIGEIGADDATGVKGKATGTGSTVGVRGEATNGYGLSTPDDARVDGVAELGSLGGDVAGNTVLSSLFGRGLTAAEGELGVSTTRAWRKINEASGTPPTDTSRVGISGDGSVAVVGVPDSTVAGDSEAGEVLVKDLRTGRPVELSITAGDSAMADNFGFSAAISSDGTTVIAGAQSNDSEADNAGKAYAYDLTPVVNNPNASAPETPLTADNASTDDKFGYSVDISGDGSRAIVGAALRDAGNSGSGAAYVYDLTATDPDAAETYITPSTPDSEAKFGFSAAISDDGSTAIVGALGDSSEASAAGKVYVYDLTVTDPNTAERQFTSNDADALHQFGYSVEIDRSGQTAIVGANRNDTGATNAGKAYVYDLTQDPPAETQITAGNPSASDQFGVSVDISEDGSTYIVGSNEGKVYRIDAPTSAGSNISAGNNIGPLGVTLGPSVAINNDGTSALFAGYNSTYAHTPTPDLSF